MRLATYTRAGRESYGAILPGGVCDVPALWPEGPKTLLKALQAGPDMLQKIEALAPAGNLQLSTPAAKRLRSERTR